MRYIDQLREGMHVSDVYLCKTKQIALTKNGKEYGSLLLQDKTGTVDAKIWDLGSPGIGTFEAMDYVYLDGDVTRTPTRSMSNASAGPTRTSTYRRIICRCLQKTSRKCMGSWPPLSSPLKIRTCTSWRRDILWRTRPL